MHDDWQVPYRFGFGGKQRSSKICLKSSLCWAASQAMHIGHPRSFNTVQSLTSVFLSSARVSGPLVSLLNQLGLSHRSSTNETNPSHLEPFPNQLIISSKLFSAKSGNIILDSLLEGVSVPVLEMKKEIEEYHREGRTCRGAKGRTGPAGFCAVSDNVSLEVRKGEREKGFEIRPPFFLEHPS